MVKTEDKKQVSEENQDHFKIHPPLERKLEISQQN
jgi:hypothetical protein